MRVQVRVTIARESAYVSFLFRSIIVREEPLVKGEGKRIFSRLGTWTVFPSKRLATAFSVRPSSRSVKIHTAFFSRERQCHSVADISILEENHNSGPREHAVRKCAQNHSLLPFVDDYRSLSIKHGMRSSKSALRSLRSKWVGKKDEDNQERTQVVM
jgi:hypothetical protein